MNNKLKRIINEEFNRSIQQKQKYERTRALVESYVREALAQKLMENSGSKNKKLLQVRQALSDPTINKSGLARKIGGLSHDDDARRSEISKIARGEWEPPTEIQNSILHTLSTNA